MTASKREKCGGKFIYATWERAVHAALVSNRRSGLPLRAYDCSTCGGFHITRNPGNPAVATRPAPFTPADLAKRVTKQPPSEEPAVSQFSNVKVVSGGHGANTVVTCNGKLIEGVIGLKFDLESPGHVALLTLTIEGAEVDVEALRVAIDGEQREDVGA